MSQLLTESRTSSWCSRLGILSQAAPAFFCPRALSPRGWLSALWGRTFRRGVGSRHFGGAPFGRNLAPRGNHDGGRPGWGGHPNCPAPHLWFHATQPALRHICGSAPPKFGCRQCVSMAAIGLRVINARRRPRRRHSPRRGVGSRHFASTPLGRDLTPRGNPQDARTPKPHSCGP